VGNQGGGRGYLVVGLDLLFMGVNFSALTLFAALKSLMASELGLTGSIAWWAAATYSAGIFAAFFAGHSRFSEERPRATVLVAALLAAVPQFLIPFSLSPYEVVALRFVQGMVMMCVPIFSAQVGRVYAGARPLALGIILAGIFIGGFVGSSVGPALSSVIGWRGTYLLFGALMIAVALIWVFTTPKETLPVVKHVGPAGVRAPSVWRDKFTIVWGFSFFPAIWIIFTLAPLIHFIASSMGWGHGAGRAASQTLEASYIAWSVIIGASAYALARGSREPRKLFNSFSKVQVICFSLAAVGSFIAYASSNLSTFLASVALVAIIQGTGPTFWSVPSTAYPRELATRAGYALGLISNAAALIGPVTTVLMTSLTIRGMWLLTAGLAIAGALLTAVASRMELPIERVSKSTTPQ